MWCEQSIAQFDIEGIVLSEGGTRLSKVVGLSHAFAKGNARRYEKRDRR